MTMYFMDLNGTTTWVPLTSRFALAGDDRFV
jgi:hypothetical protein